MEYGTRDSIRQRLATLEGVTNERDNFILENGILLGRIEKLSVELSRYTGTSVKVSSLRSRRKGDRGGCPLRFRRFRRG